MYGWMFLPDDGVRRSSRFSGELLCACSDPASTQRVSSVVGGRSPSCRCLRVQTWVVRTVQGRSRGARGGHQDYHRAAWTGTSTPRSKSSPSSTSSQAGSNMASGGETRVSSRRLPNATVTNLIQLS